MRIRTIIWMSQHPTEYPSQISKNRKLGLFRCCLSFVLEQFHRLLVVSTALDYLETAPATPHSLQQKDRPRIDVAFELLTSPSSIPNSMKVQEIIPTWVTMAFYLLNLHGISSPISVPMMQNVGIHDNLQWHLNFNSRPWTSRMGNILQEFCIGQIRMCF
jgi:hypothetical protein